MRREESGQALVEYALVSWLIMAGGLFLGRNLTNDFIAAYDVYIEGFWLIITLPVP